MIPASLLWSRTGSPSLAPPFSLAKILSSFFSPSAKRYAQTVLLHRLFSRLLPVPSFNLDHLSSSASSWLPLALQYGEVFTVVLLGRRLTYFVGSEANNTFVNAKGSDVSAEDAYASLTVPVFGEGVLYDCPNSVMVEQKK